MAGRQAGRRRRRRRLRLRRVDRRPQAQAVAERRVPRSRLRVDDAPPRRRRPRQQAQPAGAAVQPARRGVAAPLVRQRRARAGHQPAGVVRPATGAAAAAAARRVVRARTPATTAPVQPGPGARALRQHHRRGRLPDDVATVAGQVVGHAAALVRRLPGPAGRPRGTPVAAVHAVPGPARLVVRRVVAVLVAHVHRVVVHRRGAGVRGGRPERQTAAAAAAGHAAVADGGRDHRPGKLSRAPRHCLVFSLWFGRGSARRGAKGCATPTIPQTRIVNQIADLRRLAKSFSAVFVANRMLSPTLVRFIPLKPRDNNKCNSVNNTRPVEVVECRYSPRTIEILK